MLGTERLGDGDLHMIDVPTVPDRLKDRVREAQGEQVEDGLFAEIVVDPEDLVLVEAAVEIVVEAVRGFEIGAERLLHDEPGEGATLARVG